MNSEKQRRIERRAYALWEAEGQPHGRHEEHWYRAAGEIDSEETTSAAVKPSFRRALGRKAGNSGSFPPKRQKKVTS
jgi:hypothetical protein